MTASEVSLATLCSNVQKSFNRHDLIQDLQEQLNFLLKTVPGLEAITISDRDGVRITKGNIRFQIAVETVMVSMSLLFKQRQEIQPQN